MKFNQCQKDIIDYIRDYNNRTKTMLTPCIEVFQKIFENQYTHKEIEENILVLVSRGILKPYSFHGYLDFTETFKSSLDNINNNQI